MAALHEPNLNEAQALFHGGKIRETLEIIRELMASRDLKSFEYETAGRLIAEAAGSGVEGLSSIRVAVLGGYTTGPLVSALRSALLSEGFLANIYEAEYDTYRQEILNPKSGLYAFEPDLVLLAVGPWNIHFIPAAWSSSAQVEETLRSQAEEFQGLWKALTSSLACPVIQHTISNPNYNFVGPVEMSLEWSPRRYFHELNRKLVSETAPNVHWLDVAQLASRVGEWNWHNERFYYHGKLGFNPKYLTEYVHLFLGVFRALWGRTKKCLVLDLDNTLWGGVIGEDGIEGIALGPMSSVGEAHAAFCFYIKQLKERGVVLAACSKNYEEVARVVFEKHSHMPLRMDDWTIFRCNWEDKPANLRSIAQHLNLDLSSLVFVDDDPVECDFIRHALPSVAVVKLPEDPADFIRSVDSRHFFDAIRVSETDEKRSASYAARAQAEILKESSIDFETYMQHLDMSAIFCKASSVELDRLAQLEMKTNQFNLTTRRYSEKQLADFMEESGRFVFFCRLKDKFTDHGIVSSIVASLEGDALRIDSWLMSCRVFSRSLEHFMLNQLAEFARNLGARCLRGEYRPTPSNRKFSGLYLEFGFRPEKSDDLRECWTLEIDEKTQPLINWITSRSL